MLKQYPTLRYVLQKGFWYLLTFIVAIAINFTLPRLGENNPVDIIMGKAAQGLSPEEAKKKKDRHSNEYLSFLAPQTGLEPVTPRLTAACSTD